MKSNIFPYNIRDQEMEKFIHPPPKTINESVSGSKEKKRTGTGEHLEASYFCQALDNNELRAFLINDTEIQPQTHQKT